MEISREITKSSKRLIQNHVNVDVKLVRNMPYTGLCECFILICSLYMNCELFLNELWSDKFWKKIISRSEHLNVAWPTYHGSTTIRRMTVGRM